MKLYKTSRSGTEITEVESERQSDSSVWINGDRSAWISEWRQYHKSFEDAKEYLVKNFSREVATAKGRLEHYEEQLRKVNALTPTAHA